MRTAIRAAIKIGSIILVVASVNPTLAQPALAPAPGPDVARLDRSTGPGFDRLAKPLDRIGGNMLDFEREGWLSITSARFEKIEFNGQDAFIWTLRVNRPIRCAHILLLLDQLKDVRFYFDVPQTQLIGRLPPSFEVFRTVVNYSDRIQSGAANGEMLQKDDIFDVWVYMRPIDIGQIIGRKANRVVFSNYGRLRRNKTWREHLKPAVSQTPLAPGGR